MHVSKQAIGVVRHRQTTRRPPADETLVNTLEMALELKNPLVQRYKLTRWGELVAAYTQGRIAPDLLPKLQPFMVRYGIHAPHAANS